MIVTAYCEEDTMDAVPRGPAAFEEIPLITMVEAMPGFPARHGFALVRLDETGVLCALSSVDEPGWAALSSSLTCRAASPSTVNCHESAASSAQGSSP